MVRDFGLLEAVHAAVPDAVVLAAAALTQLGDVWLFAVVLTALYWYGERERGLELLAIALGALGLVVLLKATLELPRPTLGPPLAIASVPPPLREAYAAAVAADGYGFPSGHAVGATVVWGALALEPGPRRRERLLAAGVAILVVAASRIVLGVHYAGDVVAGVAVGAAYLWAVSRLAASAEDAVAALLFVAAVLAGLGVVASGGAADAVGTLGAVAGIAVGWRLAPPPADTWAGDRRGLALGVVGAVGVLGAGLAAHWLAGVAGLSPPLRMGIAGGLGTALVVAAPRVATQKVSR